MIAGSKDGHALSAAGPFSPSFSVGATAAGVGMRDLHRDAAGQMLSFELKDQYPFLRDPRSAILNL